MVFLFTGIVLLLNLRNILGFSSSRFLKLQKVQRPEVSINRRFRFSSYSNDTSAASATSSSSSSSSWKSYQYSTNKQKFDPLKRSFEKSGGILYRTSALSSSEYDVIKNDVSAIMSSSGGRRLFCEESKATSFAKNRIGASLSPTSRTVALLRDSENSLSKIVNRVVGYIHTDDDSGDPYELSMDIPVDIRIYEKNGACMDWHVDDVLYEPPQIEIIYTIENNSDCVTMWKEQDEDGVLKGVETDANSVILLKAGGPLHCVTPLKRSGGRRIIMKCIYKQKNAKYVGDYTQQFQTAAAMNNNTKKNKSKKKRKR